MFDEAVVRLLTKTGQYGKCKKGKAALKRVMSSEG